MKRLWTVPIGILGASVVLAPLVIRAEEQAAAVPADAAVVTPEEQARRATPVAVVNDAKITVGEFEERLNTQGPFRRAQYAAPEKRREFLDELIDWELQAQEARRRSLQDDEGVREQVKRVMSSLLLRREVDDRLRPEDVTEEEMRSYFDANLSTFQRPERVRAYHILVADRAKAQSLLDRIIRDNVDTREFRELARENSEDTVTSRRGGDLRYFTRPEERTAEDTEEVDAAVVQATFELLKQRRAAQARASKAGGTKVVDPELGAELPGFNPVYPKLVETPRGFHIVRFMGHREAVKRTFEEVAPQIRNRIWREKLQKSREDFIAGLREKHRVTIDDNVLGLVKVEESPMSKRPMPLGPGIQPHKMVPPPLGPRGEATGGGGEQGGGEAQQGQTPAGAGAGQRDRQVP